MAEPSPELRSLCLDGKHFTTEPLPGLELKNKYASDFIKFYNRRQEAEKYFTERGYVIKNERDFTEVEIKGTAEVANILKCNPQLFDDFEVLKGNMDNVFIKVTGKELQAGLL